MSLMSLLIALAAERYLSSSAWQFNVHFKNYKKFFTNLTFFDDPNSSVLSYSFFLITPVLLCYFLLGLVDDGLLHFIISTLILIGCFGCVKTRETYKQYLMAAFRGEPTTCQMHHKELLERKNLPEMEFGQMLIWLNYRYYIAIMIFFVLFGAPGALLYRLVARLNEEKSVTNKPENEISENIDVNNDVSEAVIGVESDELSEASKVKQVNTQLLFGLDWLPARIVAFGYMLVGHFSRAIPVWLESFFDLVKSPHLILIEVAQKSEDFMIDKEDCTAEPCLLVRLAKRTLLLCLAVIAILILTGVIS